MHVLMWLGHYVLCVCVRMLQVYCGQLGKEAELKQYTFTYSMDALGPLPYCPAFPKAFRLVIGKGQYLPRPSSALHFYTRWYL